MLTEFGKLLRIIRINSGDTSKDMAKKLNMQLIAEGVETPVQAELLQTMGCHTMQGFHYSLPLNSDAYIELLSSLR